MAWQKKNDQFHPIGRATRRGATRRRHAGIAAPGQAAAVSQESRSGSSTCSQSPAGAAFCRIAAP
eukprot:640045-Lingulodinium_polyedra.AAC.1